MTQPLVKSALRTFVLLEVFARKRVSMTCQQIAKETGWPLSSTLALVKSAVATGYFECRANKRYMPAPKIRTLTAWVKA